MKYFVMAYDFELCMHIKISNDFDTREEAVNFASRYSIITKICTYSN